jgi:hypothetical protein
MEAYHFAWLAAHPDRSEDWLKARLYEGFDIHHMDGNHENNAIDNLVLIEHTDHMRLHDLPLRRLVKRSGHECKRIKKARKIKEPFQVNGEWIYPVGYQHSWKEYGR